MDDTVRIIRENGWRQGMVLPLAAMSAQEKHCSCDNKDGVIAIVVSQSCDVLHHCLNNEPMVEILIASRIDKQNNAFIHRRHPRKLHFPIVQNNETVWYEANICHRHCIERRVLAEHSPDMGLQIHPDDVKTISLWIASRYLRHAFPDNFVKRIDRNRIRKLLKQEKSAYLSGIYLCLSSHDELPDDESYDVEIVGTITADDFGNASKRESAIELVNAVASAMQSDGKVEVNYECLSEQEMTVHDLRSFSRMSDFDDLSYGDDPPVELI